MVPANNRLGSSYSDKIANPDIGNMVPLGLPLLQDGHALVPRLFDFKKLHNCYSPFWYCTSFFDIIYIFSGNSTHL